MFLPHSIFFRKLNNYIQLEGFYLESDPCLVCNNPEPSYTVSYLQYFHNCFKTHDWSLLSCHFSKPLQICKKILFSLFLLPSLFFQSCKLSAIKSDIRYTTKAQVIKLSGNFSISKMNIKIGDVKRAKMVGFPNVVYFFQSASNKTDFHK